MMKRCTSTTSLQQRKVDQFFRCPSAAVLQANTTLPVASQPATTTAAIQAAIASVSRENGAAAGAPVGTAEGRKPLEMIGYGRIRAADDDSVLEDLIQQVTRRKARMVEKQRKERGSKAPRSVAEGDELDGMVIGGTAAAPGAGKSGKGSKKHPRTSPIPFAAELAAAIADEPVAFAPVAPEAAEGGAGAYDAADTDAAPPVPSAVAHPGQSPSPAALVRGASASSSAGESMGSSASQTSKSMGSSASQRSKLRTKKPSSKRPGSAAAYEVTDDSGVFGVLPGAVVDEENAMRMAEGEAS